jgi:glycosyltransferase involved in cell wall biosynthesis
MGTVLLVERIPLSLLNSTNPAIVDMCKLLTRRGHKVIALTLNNFERQKDIVETFTVPFHFQRQKHMLKLLISIGFSILAPIYAAYIAKRKRVDVICYNDVVPIFWPIAWFFLKDVKKVHFEGDFITEYISKKGLGRFIYNPLFQVEKWHWNQYDIVAVTSKAFMRLLLVSGVHGKHIKILPESVDTHLFRAGPRKTSKGLSFPFPLVIHGILTHYKGIDILLYAVKKVMDKGYRVHLTIIGDGPEKPVLKRLARKLNIEKAISMLGWVPLARVPQLVSNAKLGVVLRRKSLSNELVLTQALLQYACLGVPILAPDTETIRQEMKDRESLITYQASNADDMAEKIIFAIENEALLDKFAASARQIVMAHHSREIVAEKAAVICLSLML